MSTSILAIGRGKPDDLETLIREYIAGESAALAPPTIERYKIVTESLFEFLDTVDVRHRLGVEIARRLEAERERLGQGAFLPTLGVVSLLRMLPDFLVDPWLPPRGAQRGSHRVVVERLLVFLRRRGLVDSAVVRGDFSRVRKAIGTTHGRDYGWHTHEEAVTEEVLEVTVGLRSAVLDPLLNGVEQGTYASLADAIDAQLDLERRYREPYGFW